MSELPCNTGLGFDDGAEPEDDEEAVEDAWLDSDVAWVVTEVLVKLEGVVYPLLWTPPLTSEWSLNRKIILVYAVHEHFSNHEF